jgi:hypothetical protein
MMARLGRSSTMAGAASNSAPAPTAVEWVGAPPPIAESALEALARWIDGGGLLGGGNSVLG